MTMPLRMSFEVACSVEHAFAVWTARIDAWWPADHTVTGRPTRVVLEAGVGGRIYECDAEGAEHDWGEVTDWRPPTRLGYLWHLGGDRADASVVEINFAAVDPAVTRVEIEHRGWEKLGEAARIWRARNQLGWDSLLPHYLTALTEEGA
ncbi:MAG: SRPBCC domain-containing protein [Actinomycetota bacterium]|nr:SRPBCC domain-containing protein [Actinomycetota bacterium]MDQ2956105.1 SRPBCC domain-containing protein [Actinomycetota bacterium]